MKRKVETAIFDNDLRCHVGKYEISEDGTQIRIKSGGESHFMPTFNNDTFLELPKRKKYLIFGEQTYRRLYIVKKKASACVDFRTEPPNIPLPDREQLKQSLAATSLNKIGKPEQHFPSWVIWAILGLNIFLMLLQLGVI